MQPREQLLLLISEGAVAVLTPAGAWHGGALGSCWVHPRVAWALTIFPVDLGCLRVANPGKTPVEGQQSWGRIGAHCLADFHFLVKHQSGRVARHCICAGCRQKKRLYLSQVLICTCILRTSRLPEFVPPFKHPNRDCWWKNMLRTSRRSMLIK